MRRLFTMTMIILIAGSLSVFPENMQKVYPVDSPIYEGIRTLYAQAQMAPPSSSGPYSAAELSHMLHYLPKDQLSRQGKELHAQLLQALDTPDMSASSVQGSIGFVPAFEVYTHTNEDDYRLDTDWFYDYDHRSPLVGIPIELFMTDYIYNQTDFAILKTRITYNNAEDITDTSEIFSPLVNTNFPFSEDLVDQVDLNFPERAVIGMGFDQISLTLGRDDLNWSSGNTGSLTVGDHLDFYDFIRFSTFSDKFKYTYLISGFDSPSWTSSSQNSTVVDDDTDPATTDDNLKMYIAHRFEFRWLQDRVSFALTEAMIYQTAAVDFRYLNPAMFFHDLFIRGNANSTLAVELEVNPIRNITVYGNILVDEFPYPGEDQSSSGAHPTAIGQQYGIEGVYPLGPGFITGWAEYVKTDPFLYLRDEVDYIVNRRMFNMEKGFAIDRNFLGYEYGNDVLVMAGGLSYQWFDVLTGSVMLLSMQHGENDIDTEWGMGPDNVEQSTPYDDPATLDMGIEQSLLISARIEATPFTLTDSTLLDGLGFMTQLDVISHQNKDNVLDSDTRDLQLSVGVSWEF
ncbi:MAG: hypothetical protein K9M84_12580 [Spirochaetia bacterium]|nr:hypothetical protein [Spirochaetia bacterium]